MEEAFTILAWSGLFYWMIIQQSKYVYSRSHIHGIDHHGSPYGGLLPVSLAGLLLGVTLGWFGAVVSLSLIGISLLGRWALQSLSSSDAAPSSSVISFSRPAQNPLRLQD